MRAHPTPARPLRRIAGRAAVCAAATLGLAPAAAAQQAAPASFYRWLAPPVEDQLVADTTPIPPGRGAIFVPLLSDPDSEPHAIVFDGVRQVASGPNGSRLILEPGAYTVRVGSGPPRQNAEASVRVAAGQTAVVPVRWGGLRVEVVDEHNIPHRGSFELFSAADRRQLLVGFGANTLRGERLATLLVPPGLYRIVRRGENYRARTDFSTVEVGAGDLVHFKLVLDATTGSLLGGAVVRPEEIGIVTEAAPWSRIYSIGVSLPYSSTTNVVGAPNQTSVAVDVFLDAYLTYQRRQDFLSGVFEVEQGVLKISPEGSPPPPLQKTRDRVRADLFYTRFVSPRIGPYARFGLLTNARASSSLVTEDMVVAVRRIDGSRDALAVPANSNFRTGDAFSPHLWREGAGVNARLLRRRELRLDWRGGVGLRQNRFNRALFLDDDPLTPELEYREASSFNEGGVEMTLVATARLRLLLLNSNFDLFGNIFGGSGDGFMETTDELHATIDWRNTVSFRLTSDLSIDYRLDLLRLPQVRPENQVTQSVLIRYSFGS